MAKAKQVAINVTTEQFNASDKGTEKGKETVIIHNSALPGGSRIFKRRPDRKSFQSYLKPLTPDAVLYYLVISD